MLRKSTFSRINKKMLNLKVLFLRSEYIIYYIAILDDYSLRVNPAEEGFRGFIIYNWYKNETKTSTIELNIRRYIIVIVIYM